jgi:hypothetical protein
LITPSRWVETDPMWIGVDPVYWSRVKHMSSLGDRGDPSDAT